MKSRPITHARYEHPDKGEITFDLIDHPSQVTSAIVRAMAELTATTYAHALESDAVHEGERLRPSTSRRHFDPSRRFRTQFSPFGSVENVRRRVEDGTRYTLSGPRAYGNDEYRLSALAVTGIVQPGSGLAPDIDLAHVLVRPELQRSGFGSMAVHAAIKHGGDMGAPIIASVIDEGTGSATRFADAIGLETRAGLYSPPMLLNTMNDYAASVDRHPVQASGEVIINALEAAKPWLATSLPVRSML